MPTVKTTLAAILAKPITAAERATLTALATRPDREIDFSDQEEITPEKIATGRYRVVSRGGLRPGAGRKATGNRAVKLRLPSGLVRSLRAEARRQGTTLSAVATARLTAR
jgi:hypothetical protein